MRERLTVDEGFDVEQRVRGKLSEQETDRIRRVYRTFIESVRTRWDPDNPGNRAIVSERRAALKQLLRSRGAFPGGATRILEVGCGSGKEIGGFLDWGVPAAELHGVDLLPEQIDAARASYPGIHFSCGNAEALEFESGMFDLALVYTVFSSILNRVMADNVAKEIIRVLTPGGAVIWYDFRYNSPGNRHVRGVSSRRVREIFAGLDCNLQSITLLPPLARRLGRWTPILYPTLSQIPFLRTHYLGLLVKPGQLNSHTH